MQFKVASLLVLVTMIMSIAAAPTPNSEIANTRDTSGLQVRSSAQNTGSNKQSGGGVLSFLMSMRQKQKAKKTKQAAKASPQGQTPTPASTTPTPPVTPGTAPAAQPASST